MEWNEFFFSDEFKAYRKRQVEVVAKRMHALLTNYQNTDAARIAGALNMAFDLIALPRHVITDEKKLGMIGSMIEADIADCAACLIHKRFLKYMEEAED